jgi:hypothetical protein
MSKRILAVACFSLVIGVCSAAPKLILADTLKSSSYQFDETIATAPKSSGVTTFTITYVLNVRSLTPGGQYTSSQQLVCIATY